MPRPLASILLAPVLLAATSAPVPAEREPIDAMLARAQAEAATAEREVDRLEAEAAKSRDEAERLAAERQAAAAAIGAAEARISAADAALKLAEARVAMQAAELAERQAPVASLLAGIAFMGRRPPLLSVADRNSLDEFIRVRALLDTTLPVIRARSAALSAEVAAGRRLQESARVAAARLATARDDLGKRQDRLASLELQASERAARLGAGAVAVGDVMLARGEDAEGLTDERQRRAAGRRLARELAAFAPPPPRPAGPVTKPSQPSLAYRLPVDAALTEGHGAIGDSGIRSRGLTFDSRRGSPVAVPADGTIAFAGAFRRYDGVIIIDHGGGWMSLLTGVRTALATGSKVRAGDPLGRALGPVTVELSTNGRFVSAALIARSSDIVSNGGNKG